MSRRDFRGQVDAPRPGAAWVMSIVASATLWATEQLPLWVILLQITSFAISFAVRANPPALLRNPILLNIGMLGITTITVRAALAGNPATVSLAFFTALAQSLQLLDARPRRTEFILVAVGLFQVILASNLTDSVFFPPLVLLFVVSVTWTLLIHTLQMEAAEAGEPEAAQHVVSSDLRRMTALATAGCLVLALILFLMLPRMKTQMVKSHLGAGLALSGFSNTVQLGNVGRIRQDHTVVLRVESLEGALPVPEESYWRGLAFDHFDGRAWSISDGMRPVQPRLISGIGRFGIDLEANRAPDGQADGPQTTQRIIREPVASGVLFTTGRPKRIAGPFQHLKKDLNGGLYLSEKEKERTRYTIWSNTEGHPHEELHQDRAQPPLEAAVGRAQPALKYLAMPPGRPHFEEFLRPIAERLVGDAATDFERAMRLQQGLRREGRYTDSPPPMGQSGASPIQDFLHGDLEGHCEYFASAMVLLARSLDLPARLVNGFAGGTYNSVGAFLEVTRADAHAWVEIHFEDAGWIRFDPTPPDRRLRLAETPSLWGRAAQLGSAIELWWFQRVVDFDSADQIGGIRLLWRAWNGKGSVANAPSPNEEGAAHEYGPKSWGTEAFGGLALLVFGGLLIAALIQLRAQHRRSAASPVPETYRRALALLRRRGWDRSPRDSARDLAYAFSKAAPEETGEAFQRVTESYLAERFGRREGTNLTQEIEILERTIDRVGLRDQPDITEHRLRTG